MIAFCLLWKTKSDQHRPADDASCIWPLQMEWLSHGCHWVRGRIRSLLYEIMSIMTVWPVVTSWHEWGVRVVTVWGIYRIVIPRVNATAVPSGDNSGVGHVAFCIFDTRKCTQVRHERASSEIAGRKHSKLIGSARRMDSRSGFWWLHRTYRDVLLHSNNVIAAEESAWYYITPWMRKSLDKICCVKSKPSGGQMTR